MGSSSEGKRHFKLYKFSTQDGLTSDLYTNTRALARRAWRLGTVGKEKKTGLLGLQQRDQGRKGASRSTTQSLRVSDNASH